MRKGPPTADELPHIVSIRNAVEGREWSDELEERLAVVLRVFAMSRQRRRQADWERKRYHRDQDGNGGKKSGG